MDIQITCNTEDGVLFYNIEQNSRLPISWVKMEHAHDGHAVIVGGGPSLKDTLPIIRWRQELGQKIFALNGAAKFLIDNGIHVDYHVICDARPENKCFIEGSKAGTILLSSQCAHSLFEKAIEQKSTIVMWHPTIEGIDKYIPEHDDEYALIGGGTTVGLSTMCLTYTMGYRKIHLFGYDSCHSEDRGHAYSQPMNDGDQLATIEVFGRRFSTSIAMARQAQLFPFVSGNLIDAGCVITVDGDGLIPWVAKYCRPSELSEKEKYEMMWDIPDYREHSCGEQIVGKFIEVVNPELGALVIDFGCGSGKAAKAIAKANLKPFLIDFTDNSRDEDEDIKSHPFLQWDLTKPLPISSKYGFCSDVLEHLPTDCVDVVISHIMDISENVFFQVSMVPDNFGNFIGQKLHLTVEPFVWWVKKFEDLGFSIEWSRDDVSSGMFFIKRK